MANDNQILLDQRQHADLSQIAQSRALPAGFVFRAKLILMLAEGASFNAIKRQLQTTAPTIIRWKQRFRQSGLDGLDTYHPGQKPSVLTPALRARILSATRRKPRLERYMASDDPEFESNAADILGLYLHPPKHAVVFCVDEKTATFKPRIVSIPSCLSRPDAPNVTASSTAGMARSLCMRH
jgi:hypothetical protein